MILMAVAGPVVCPLGCTASLLMIVRFRKSTQTVCRRIAMPSSLKLAIVVTVLMLPRPSTADIAPIRLRGEIGYDGRSEHFDDGEDFTEHVGVLSLDFASYIAQPWLALAYGRLVSDLRRRDNRRDSGDGSNVTGDLTLRIFPQSRFPLETFIERSDSRSDTALTGFDRERTRYGFLQRFTTTAGTGYRLRYEHIDQSSGLSPRGRSLERDDDVGNLLNLGFNKNTAAHHVNFDATVNRIDTTDVLDTFERTQTFVSSLRHSYRPGPRLTADDLLTVNRTTIDRAGADYDADVVQFNSYAYWRPDPNTPLRVSGTLRTLSRTNRTAPRDVSAHSATSTLGATYERGRNWVLVGNLGVTGVDASGVERTESFQTVNASYASTPHRRLGLETAWFAAADLRNDALDTQSIQAAGAQVGYTAGRNWRLGTASTLVADLRQSIAQQADTEDFDATALLSTAAISWSLRTPRRNAFARLTFSDSRSQANSTERRSAPGDFQLANLQISAADRLSSDASLSVNVTVQATRNSMAGVTAPIAGDGRWRSTASADLSYFTKGLFRVNRLSFRSTLRFISTALVFDQPRQLMERNDRYWENRLEYGIGRLRLRAITRLTQIRDRTQSLVLFQLRRSFGDA